MTSDDVLALLSTLVIGCIVVGTIAALLSEREK